MKKSVLIIVLSLVSVSFYDAQLLKNLKDKLNNEVNKTVGKITKKPENKTSESQSVSSKSSSVISDFISGKTVIYFDNFENDNLGETPEGWQTNNSADIVTLDGISGKWVEMTDNYSTHIARSKKTSWGNNFTVEFDFIVDAHNAKGSPRVNFSLSNSLGKLVTDEKNLSESNRYANVLVSTILSEGATSRLSLYTKNNLGSAVYDDLYSTLPFNEMIHISMSVQGKRFRMWWNDKKLFDVTNLDETKSPNLLVFNLTTSLGAKSYVSNIRIAKDIPATREEATEISNNVIPKNTVNSDKSDNIMDTDSYGNLNIKSKILNANLPFTQILKGEKIDYKYKMYYTYVFQAMKNENDDQENFIKVTLLSPTEKLKPGTYYFEEFNATNPSSQYKSLPIIRTSKTTANLNYGTAKKPFVSSFSPFITEGHMSKFYDNDLAENLPKPTEKCKLVIEKIENGKASGYFSFGVMIDGLKPITKGDAMTQTFTKGFAGEMSGSFTDVPIY